MRNKDGQKRFGEKEVVNGERFVKYYIIQYEEKSNAEEQKI